VILANLAFTLVLVLGSNFEGGLKINSTSCPGRIFFGLYNLLNDKIARYATGLDSPARAKIVIKVSPGLIITFWVAGNWGAVFKVYKGVIEIGGL